MIGLQPILNFEILPTYDLRVLLVADLSMWQHLEDVATYIDVTVPGSSKPATVNFNKGKVNIFNSSLLNINPVTSYSALTKLPDGIYTIKIYPCQGETFCFEKAYLRTIKTQLELDEAFIKLKLSCGDISKQIMDKHLKADLLLMSAHANVRDGNLIQGKLDFDNATELLEQILECDDCT